jgi:hypothetical protein
MLKVVLLEKCQAGIVGDWFLVQQIIPRGAFDKGEYFYVTTTGAHVSPQHSQILESTHKNVSALIATMCDLFLHDRMESDNTASMRAVQALSDFICAAEPEPTPGTQEITYSIEFTTPNPLTIIAAPIDMDAFPRDEPVSEGRLKEVVTNQVKAGVFPVNRRFVPITGGRLIRYATTREVIFET